MTLDTTPNGFDFTTPKDGYRTGCTKWTAMSALTKGEPASDALPMWVAQMDFQPAPVIAAAAQEFARRGEYGYFTGAEDMFAAVARWTETRHGWRPEVDQMRATHGLGNAIGLTLQSLTAPGDGIVIFTPVYHEFAAKIGKNGRRVVESPLIRDADGHFRMDLDTLERDLTGHERAVMISSPHNPAGRVWSAEELRALAAFCARHDLLLISDEIHQDLTFTGHTHIPTAIAAPDCLDRLIVLSAASKTFDIAGLRTGTTIIPDPDLRARFTEMHRALDIAPNRAGVDLTVAAYSDGGAAWVDALQTVLEDNHRLFCGAVNAVPGLHAYPMQATYLAWVNFTALGMDEDEITRRLHDVARIVPTPGTGLGTGGAFHRRFNLGAPRSMIVEAARRLTDAFADVQ